jgi:rubredoxin
MMTPVDAPATGVPVGPTTRLECRVCWTIYDPAQGDAVAQIPAGTPFDRLPARWTCPTCSAPKDGFLVIADDER